MKFAESTDVVDAFTGQPIADNPSVRCACGCRYMPESLAALREHNQSNCIGCGSKVEAQKLAH